MTAHTSTRTTTGAPIAATLPASTGATGRALERLPVAAMAAVGGGLVVVGALIPWLSFFAGLQAVHGSDGPNGRILAALGVVTLLAALAHLGRGRAATRWLLAGLGFATVALAGFLGIELLRAFAQLARDPLLVTRVEPGLGLALLGGSVVLATVFVPADDGSRPNARRPASSASHMALAAVVGFAGVVHVVLTPEHLAMSAPLGLGFLIVGIVQVVLAPLVLVAGTRALLAAAFVVSLGSAIALLAATTVGLPLLGHGETMGVLGPVEPIDDLAAMTGLAEVVGVVLSVRLLRRTP